jgi:dihydroorotate dehydrogenase
MELVVVIHTLVLFGALQTGGLSGKPLFEPSTAVLGKVYALSKGKIPLIGVSGVVLTP